MPKIPVQGIIQSEAKYDEEVNQFFNNYVSSIDASLADRLPRKYYYRKGTRPYNGTNWGNRDNALPSHWRNRPIGTFSQNYILRKDTTNFDVNIILLFNTVISIPANWISLNGEGNKLVRSFSFSLDSTQPKLLVKFINSLKRQYSDQLYSVSNRVLSEAIAEFNAGVSQAEVLKSLVDELREIYQEAIRNSTYFPFTDEFFRYVSVGKYIDDFLSNLTNYGVFRENNIDSTREQIAFERQQVNSGRPTSIEIHANKRSLINKLINNYFTYYYNPHPSRRYYGNSRNRNWGDGPRVEAELDNSYYRRTVEELEALLANQEQEIRARLLLLAEREQAIMARYQPPAPQPRQATIPEVIENVNLPHPSSEYERPIALEEHPEGTIMVNFKGEGSNGWEKNTYKRLYSQEEVAGLRGKHPLTRRPITNTRKYKIRSYAVPETVTNNNTATVPQSNPTNNNLVIINNPLRRAPLGGGKTRRRYRKIKK